MRCLSLLLISHLSTCSLLVSSALVRVIGGAFGLVPSLRSNLSGPLRKPRPILAVSPHCVRILTCSALLGFKKPSGSKFSARKCT